MTDAKTMEKMVRLKVRELDALPLVFRKLIKLLNSPYPSPRELGQVIATDQGMSLRILRMVNSAAGGVRNQVLSVQQAVSLLGINVVRSLSFVMASYDSFFSSNDQTRRDLWRHSLFTGLLSRSLALRLKFGQPEEMFVAGMLHDVGYSFLLKHYATKFEALASSSLEGLNPLEAEVAHFGASHAEIGAWTCECWKLPPLLQACVRFHHAPSEAGDFQSPAHLIHVADAWALRTLDSHNPELKYFREDSLQALQLSSDQVEECCKESLSGLLEMESYLADDHVRAS